MAVSTGPGASVLAYTPCGAPALAIQRIIPCTADLEATYAGPEATPPFFAAIEPQARILPKPRSHMIGNSFRVGFTTPSTFTDSIEFHSSSVLCARGVRAMTPAHNTRISTLP